MSDKLSPNDAKWVADARREFIKRFGKGKTAAETLADLKGAADADENTSAHKGSHGDTVRPDKR